MNLSHLASQFPGSACHASYYRRLQRFCQFVRLDTRTVALLVVHMLNLHRPKCLAIDRTNWKFGSTDVNIMMLAIVTRQFRNNRSEKFSWTRLLSQIFYQRRHDQNQNHKPKDPEERHSAHHQTHSIHAHLSNSSRSVPN